MNPMHYGTFGNVPTGKDVDPGSLKSLYDSAFTAVNPSNVKYGYGSRFPAHMDVAWRSRIHNNNPVHYPDPTSVAGLPGNVYPIVAAPDPLTVPTLVQEEAECSTVLDPRTTRYQNTPENPNAAILFKGGNMADT